MTIWRASDIVMLDGVCTVEDAENLAQELQAGAAAVDWSGCTHLHTACLQVLLAAGVPTRGVSANAGLARWLAPILPTAAPGVQASTLNPEPALRLEA